MRRAGGRPPRECAAGRGCREFRPPLRAAAEPWAWHLRQPHWSGSTAPSPPLAGPPRRTEARAGQRPACWGRREGSWRERCLRWCWCPSPAWTAGPRAAAAAAAPPPRAPRRRTRGVRPPTACAWGCAGEPPRPPPPHPHCGAPRSSRDRRPPPRPRPCCWACGRMRWRRGGGPPGRPGGRGSRRGWRAPASPPGPGPAWTCAAPPAPGPAP
mmetsp:Transcript_2298/g.6706  ORF Transcript_2298/g.6706 Transcript_2298/m.6706 type:complete len:212 (-) Transcript_2298:2442-3077(-)